jgi:hypothetical protein
MTDKPVQRTLAETDIVSNRREALRSMVARTGLGLGALAAVAATSRTAQAQDRANQTDRDPTDRRNQTDSD